MGDRDLLRWLYCYTTYQPNSSFDIGLKITKVVEELPRLLEEGYLHSADALRRWRLTPAGYAEIAERPMTEAEISENYQRYVQRPENHFF